MILELLTVVVASECKIADFLSRSVEETRAHYLAEDIAVIEGSLVMLMTTRIPAGDHICVNARLRA